jgi:hypothetical protein
MPEDEAVKGGEVRAVHFTLDSEDRRHIFAAKRKGGTDCMTTVR